MQFRTVPELLRYLDARRALREMAARRIGQERAIFEFYLLYGALSQCRGHDHARRVVETAAHEVEEIIERMVEYHFYSGLLGHVADALATRSATCLNELPAYLVARYDTPNARQNYLRMQEVLTDLPLRERAALSQQFTSVIANLHGRSKEYVHAR